MEAADTRALVEAFERREELLPVICSSRNRADAIEQLTAGHGLTAVVAEHLLDARIGSLVEMAVADLRDASSQAHDASLPINDAPSGHRGQSVAVNKTSARVGDALLRAPYAWLVATLAAFFIMLSPLSGLAKEPGDGSTPLAILAVVFVLVDAAIALIVVPRALSSRIRHEESERPAEGPAAASRLAFAAAPFLLAFSAVGFGAEQWALSVGFPVSTILLIQWARVTARAGRI